MSDNTFALVFPGQGSQKVGMLADFYSQFDCFADTFSAASEVLGYDLWALCQQGPEDKLNLTENTQPALLTSSIALFRVWQQLGGQNPDFVAGHSLGEWSALVAAGVVQLEDAVKLVQLRGRYMQEAVPVGVGAMAAVIGLDDQVIIDTCKQHDAVSAVNFNAPGQVVIAGKKEGVEAACEALKAAGAKRALLLPVSAPFHTQMMKPAADRLAEDMQAVSFSDPQIPVVHNVSAATEASGENIKALMIEQVYAPVRWVECVQTLAAKGVASAAECGPGKVLTGLMKRIDKNIATAALESLDSIKAAAE
ncbi:ACP S-malonyltransferase [Agaribacterium haliotis]|uniref:ACP S-malonyltransferase n=1 Tax=Agaribacterium haliotis TaxID=2013869 RepID=UPI000BB56A5B|nr:ACP S-malonyltransferase [Agaribacterium haliotis]